MSDEPEQDGADDRSGRENRRLHRQFETLKRDIPALRRPIDLLVRDRMRLVRLPLAALFILGSMFAILPIFGLWMLPLGLLLLAVDIPRVRPLVSGMIIRSRKWVRSRKGRG